MTTLAEPKHRSGGAPAENRNGYRHGLKSARDPAGCSYITRQGGQFREALENSLIAENRPIGVYEAALIADAVAYYKHAMKARRWLREHFDELNHDQRLKFSAEEPKALEAVTRCLKSLNLDRTDQQTMWDALDASVVPQPATREAEAAKEGKSHSETQQATQSPAMAPDEASPNGGLATESVLTD